MLSRRAANLKGSPTLALVAKAKELQKQGYDVISLTVGEPDWPTFPIPSQAGIEAIQKGITKYTAANGTPELREALVGKFQDEIGQTYTPAAIMVSPGAKFAIEAALQCLCDPGDEVVLHSPFWVSYPTMIELADGKPVIVECDHRTGFKITPELLERAITPKTKGFLFCSPSNPTGLMYSKEELKALAEVLRKHPRVVILSDDMYNRLTFNGERVAPHILQCAPDLKDRTVCFNGGSKAYAMTGWRIGWAAGPEKLIKAMGDYQSQALGAPSSISQHAALAAVKNCEKDILEIVKVLHQRREAALTAFKKIPQFKVSPPDGAFYLWVDVRGIVGKSYKGRRIESDRTVCEILLETFHVATVPGAECGSDGFMRLSFATSNEKMAAAVDRMAEFVAGL